MKFKNILPKWYSIVLWILIILFTQGCYTQLSMFYPEPEIEQEEEVDFFETYSRAPAIPNVTFYAQDGAGQSLSLAYMTMSNRFNFYGGHYMGNRFGNRYYWNEYNLGGYTMYIPYNADLYTAGERKTRTFSKDRDGSSPRTNLNVTRTQTQSSTDSNTNSSNVSSNRSSSTSSSKGSSSSSSSSSGGRRATRRN